MGATFNRVKTWTSETLTAADVNAEFDNVLDNLTPSGVDDYSASVAEMQTQTDPGEVGSESQATSMAGEIARLRQQMAELKGTTYWYTSPATTLAELNNAVGNSGLPANRLSSGKTTGNSSQSLLLTVDGTDDGFTVNATATDFVYYISGVQYTLATDGTVAATTTAPTSNNTAVLLDVAYAGAEWTKWIGMLEGQINIGTVGSEITSKNGKIASFKLVNTGTETEYFIGVVDTDNARIKDVRRGWFYDSSNARIPAITMDTGNTLTLMTTTWVFITTTGTFLTTTNQPVYSVDEPAAPAVNDMWFDIVNEVWKRWDGAAHNAANATYIGIVVTDESDNCVASRSEDYITAYNANNQIELYTRDNTTVTAKRYGNINVYGTYINMGNTELVWDMATDLDTGVTEAASTMYFFYIKENGNPVISDVAPDDFTKSRGGFYHPHETWRCVGQAWNNASSNLTSLVSYHDGAGNTEMAIQNSVSGGALTLQYFCSPRIDHAFYETGGGVNAKTVYTKKFPFYQSITVPQGATLDHQSGIEDNVVLHMLVYQQGVKLGVSCHQRGIDELVDSTAIGTASTSNIMYAASSSTGNFCKAVGYGTAQPVTAGTWSSTLSDLSCAYEMNVNRLKLALVSASASATVLAQMGSNISFYTTGKKDIRVTLCPGSTSEYYTAVSNSGTASGLSLVGFLYFYQGGNQLRKFEYASSFAVAGGTASSMSVNFGDGPSLVLNANDMTTGSQNFALYGSTTSGTIQIANAYFLLEELPRKSYI